jgi:hypothetical protein
MTVPGLNETYTTVAKLSWVEDDDLPPLDLKRPPAPAGEIGSKAWRELHHTGGCVRAYRVSWAHFEVRIEYRSGLRATPPFNKAASGMSICTCTINDKQTFGAEIVSPQSALYIAGADYLLNILSSTFAMTWTPRQECASPCISKPTEVNMNQFGIRDHRGKVVYGVHGEIDPPITKRTAVPNGESVVTTWAKWDFADPAP